MRLASWAAIAAFVVVASPVAAQDLPTNQLEQHADVVRQDTLLRSTLRNSTARRNARGATATPAQAAACAKKDQFRRQHGADNPKVQRLYGLCRNVGL